MVYRLALLLALTAPVAGQSGYRKPSDLVRRCVEAPPPPSVSLDPTRQWVVLSTREAMPSIAVQARPILRLAGRRIDPATYGRQRGTRTTTVRVRRLAGQETMVVRAGAGNDLGGPYWSAGGKRFALTNTKDDVIELAIHESESGKSIRVPGVRLNATAGGAVQWMPDQKTLLCNVVAAGDPPRAPATPSGPVVQESSGRKSPVRTYQDLLQNPHDEALFEHYATSQLVLVDAATGAKRAVGEPAIYASVRPSPDGKYLLVTRIVRPFSYLVTAWSFPQEIAVIDLDGNEIKRIVNVPLADNVPIGGVRTGPRSVSWMPAEDATLTWFEALDGGNPRAKADHRDRILVQRAPFEKAPREWMRTRDRLGGGGRRGGAIAYGQDGRFVFVTTYDRRKRWIQTWRADAGDLDAKPKLVHERSAQDAYGDPGSPVTTRDSRGRSRIVQHGDHIYLTGRGASPQGDRPFLDRWNLATGEKERLFRCAEGCYEQVVALLDPGALGLLVRHESRTEPPNYFVVAGGERTAVTRFEDEAAELTRGIEKRLLHYERADGVKLSAILYLPPGYREGERLPTLFWAYPREYGSGKDAGQVRGSPHRYVRLSGTSPLLLALCGYAVMYNAAMPVVGPTRTANDQFVEQLVMGAKAAIDKAVALGVTDRDRCAIAGHSYGAFMTANLLAHSDLFRAGIARSGAYNRTLTPFGFQNERRTFWEAPHVYFAMSPFMHAHKVDEPLLLIHGEADNNSGTFPVQSKRLYHAIKGNGGRCRLVMLPHESHGYRARESVLHCLAESIDWLDRFVKEAGPRRRKTSQAPSPDRGSGR